MSGPSGNVGIATMSPRLVLTLVALAAAAAAVLAACSSPPPPAPTPLTAPPSPTPAPTSTPAPTPTPAPRVVLADNFDDPSKGRLPPACANPSQFQCGYVDGEYQIKKLNATQAGWSGPTLTGTYSDVSVALDARVVAGEGETMVNVTCRRQPDSASWYQLTVFAERASSVLRRRDNGTDITLMPRQVSGAIRQGGGTNHIEFNCIGATISATVNGVEVASVRDATYSTGLVILQGGGVANVPADVRIDNLVVTER